MHWQLIVKKVKPTLKQRSNLRKSSGESRDWYCIYIVLEYGGCWKDHFNIILLDKLFALGWQAVKPFFCTSAALNVNTHWAPYLSQTAFHRLFSKHRWYNAPMTHTINPGRGAHLVWYLYKAQSWGQHRSPHLLTNCLTAADPACYPPPSQHYQLPEGICVITHCIKIFSSPQPYREKDIKHGWHFSHIMSST